MKKILTVLLSLTLLMLSAAACTGTAGDAEPSASAPESSQTPDSSADSETATDPYARKIGFTIEMENGDVMKGELYPDLAPETVANFVKLCNEHFYDGLIFHRVIPGFMIQGGGFDTEYNQKQAETIVGEFSANGFKNDLAHTRGVISMARTSVPDSASSQFFIMHADYPSLDGQYAAFGKITEGLDVIDKIASVETTTLPEYGMEDVPTEQQIIKTITVDENSSEEAGE